MILQVSVMDIVGREFASWWNRGLMTYTFMAKIEKIVLYNPLQHKNR